MPDDYTPLILVAALFLVILLILYVVYTKKISALTAQIDERARNEYQKWRQRDYDSLVAQQTPVPHRESQTQLNQWKIDNEAVIRQDAIARSRAVIVGKVVEHIVPYAPVFPYNPKDARFVGSPVDLIVFDGCDEGQVREIVFLEIKTGSSALTTRQRQIRDAIENGHVVWRVLKSL